MFNVKWRHSIYTRKGRGVGRDSGSRIVRSCFSHRFTRNLLFKALKIPKVRNIFYNNAARVQSISRVATNPNRRYLSNVNFDEFWSSTNFRDWRRNEADTFDFSTTHEYMSYTVKNFLHFTDELFILFTESQSSNTEKNVSLGYSVSLRTIPLYLRVYLLIM